MIHANGHTMSVVIEDLAAGAARMSEAGHPLRVVKRL
jgi:hypothetical protein